MFFLARRLVYVTAVSFALLPCVASAQSKAPNWDVVSIRPNNTGSGSISVSIDDDHFEMTNVTFAIMLMNAYNLRPAQIIDLPPWAKSEHFDVRGKVLDGDMAALKKMKPEERRPMFQVILRDRFGLQFHKETRNMPVYELVPAKSGASLQALPEQTDAEKEADEKAAEKSRGSMNVNQNGEGVVVNARGVRMVQLVATLSNYAGRTVVDKTGLPGEYNIQLRWLPEEIASAHHSENGDQLPSLFTAVQEQLGLRMVAAKGDVETLVVDHVEHPTEN